MPDNLKAVLAYTAYILVFTLLLPFLPLRLLWRSQQAPAYRERMAERFGISAIAPQPGGIWVHSVSVGETIAIAPTIKQLLEQHPDKSIAVTTMTPTGSEQVQAIFGDRYGDRVQHVYAPYDWPLLVGLFLLRVKPSLAIFVETELWPVTIGLCKLSNVKVLVANARLSEKSAAGYSKLRWLVEPMLRGISIAAQNDADAQRFIALGAEAEKVETTGSVKFDIEIEAEIRERALALRSQIGIDNSDPAQGSMRFIWIAASTHEGEDEIVLEAHRLLLQHSPNTLLVLVPRHPERFDQVAELIAAQSMAFTRRSEKPYVPPNAQVLLADTMGELLMLYGVADAAFVGGSLLPVGGHNYLEASVWGLPVISGPHRHNFLSIADELELSGALATVSSASELAAQIENYIEKPRLGREAGFAAVRLIEANRGATDKLLETIRNLLSA